MKKVLITGASGYLGMHLCRQLSGLNIKSVGLFKTEKPDIKNIENVQFDIADYSELKQLFEKYKFDLVYHLAAVTPVSSIETSESYIRKINVEATENICNLANQHHSFLVFTSSDLVYAEGDDLKEDSPLNPLTIYSRTKIEAEEIIRKLSHQFVILRTALMFGFTISARRSFFDTSYEMLKRGERVKAFSDQYRSTLFVEDAARFLIRLPSITTSNEIINFCGFEKLSRYEMVKQLAEVFEFDSNLVLPSSCEEFTDYPMVKNIGLSFEKMKKLGFIPKNYLENLRLMKKRMEH